MPTGDLVVHGLLLDVVALYEDEHARIFGYCRRQLDNDADAEDAAQEVFARAVKNLARLNGEPGPYLSGIARNVCCDMQRARRRRAAAEGPLEDASVDDGVPSPEAVAANRSELKSAVSRLTPRERALLLDFSAGYSYPEIAERQGVSRSVVSVAIVRARQRLRRIACETVSRPSAMAEMALTQA